MRVSFHMWAELNAKQRTAYTHGYGFEWARMCEEKTGSAAYLAALAAASCSKWNNADIAAWAAAWLFYEAELDDKRKKMAGFQSKKKAAMDKQNHFPDVGKMVEKQPVEEIKQDPVKEIKQDPVGLAYQVKDGLTMCIWSDAVVPVGTPLYTAPQTQNPLTDEQCDAIYEALNLWAFKFDCEYGLPLVAGDVKENARSIIKAAHGIKGET